MHSMRNKQIRKEKKLNIIGVIPQYPEHSKHNTFEKIRMPQLGLVSVLSQISHDPRFNVYAIDENNYAGPLDFTGKPGHNFLQERNPAQITMSIPEFNASPGRAST